MRNDTFRGLNQWAQQRVDRSIVVREIGKTIMPDGSEVPFDRTIDKRLADKTSYAKVEGAYVPVVADLHRYTLPSGIVYEEYVQCAPLHGGPVYHVALCRLKKNGQRGKVLKSSLWPSRETGLSPEYNNMGYDGQA